MNKWEKELKKLWIKELGCGLKNCEGCDIDADLELIPFIDFIKAKKKQWETKAEQRGVEKVEKKIYELKVRSFYSKEEGNLEVNDKKISVYHTPNNEWISRLELLKKLKKLKEEK